MGDWVERYALWAGRAFYLALFATGVVTGLGIRRLTLVFGLLAWTALWFWCALDAKKHGKVFVHSFGMVMAWTWPVSLCAYFIWTRGWRGVGAYAFGAFAAIMITITGGLLGLLVYGP